jgi:transposase
MTYPSKFRKKAISIMDREDLTIAETAERFGVGVASVARWKTQPEPAVTRNKPATKIDMEALAKDIEENPDHFLYERARKFSVSTSGMWSALKRLGLTRKKKSSASQSQ